MKTKARSYSKKQLKEAGALLLARINQFSRSDLLDMQTSIDQALELHSSQANAKPATGLHKAASLLFQLIEATDMIEQTPFSNGKS